MIALIVLQLPPALRAQTVFAIAHLGLRFAPPQALRGRPLRGLKAMIRQVYQYPLKLVAVFIAQTNLYYTL